MDTLRPTEKCRELGRPRWHGEITFVANGNRLTGASYDGEKERCLANLAPLGTTGPSAISWNAPGSRVIAGDFALSHDLATSPIENSATWSRPSGTSVVYISRDHRLLKRASSGGPETDISFLARHDAVTYHPAGTHIATSGKDQNGEYGLFLATNLGRKPHLLARGESARSMRMLRFSQSGSVLYFVADHGHKHHVHELNLRRGRDVHIETLDTSPRGFTHLTVDPFNGTAAWTELGDCAAGKPGSLISTAGEGELSLDDDRMNGRTIEALGWLRGSRLVVAARTTGCSTAQPADIFVLTWHTPTFITSLEAGTAAVRVKHPPPPPPPNKEPKVVA